MGWGFNAAKVMEMVVVQGGSQKHAKLQSDHRHPNTVTHFFYKPYAIPVPTV